MNVRYTLDGSDALEEQLRQLCAEMLHEVRNAIPQSRLEGVLLGGGYGRGEGGVLKCPEGDLPYNDLEFYLLVRGLPWLNQRRYQSALDRIAAHLSAVAGIDIESKVLSRRQLERSPTTMFYYDLVVGHRWVFGDEQLLSKCRHHTDPSRIPIAEATRLLMNRCSGLLFAKERLHRSHWSPDDADFVGRNLAKARLAFGDVILTALGQYHWSCRKRQQRLQELAPSDELPCLSQICKEHAAGVEFKLHPYRCAASQIELQPEHARLSVFAEAVWLWLENGRLHQTFGTAAEYGLSFSNKCPETKGCRNRLINAFTFGAGALFGSGGSRYPRERLLNSLPLLLWGGRFNESTIADRLRHLLNTNARTFSEFVRAYHDLWHRFN